MTQDAAAAAAAAAGGASDWSGLPEDLLLTIMAGLDVPNLIRSGAVCTSWRNARNTFHLSALEQAPCLLYACDEIGHSDGALYCPSAGSTFRVPFPGPLHEKRGFVFSCHGWVFAADEVGAPYIFNPMTGVQAALPPLKTIMNRNGGFFDDDGKHVKEVDTENGASRSQITWWARHDTYARVAMSPAAEVTACTVLIVHMPLWKLSFARPGDEEWTPLHAIKSCVSDVLYNDRDGLFYILHYNGSVSTLDLSVPSPSPTVIMILDHVTDVCIAPTMYLALAPSGELLQVWRMWDLIETPLKDRFTYQCIMDSVREGCIDFANQEHDQAVTGDQDIQVEQLVDCEVNTTMLLVFKVDIEMQKLLEIRDIGEHALFLGFNDSLCLPTKDLSGFQPNCAYLTDDCEYSPMLRKDLGIWNINKGSMQKLGDAWPNLHSWLDIPAPIWVRPKF